MDPVRSSVIATWCLLAGVMPLAACTDCPDTPTIARELAAHEPELMAIWSSFPAEVCVRGVGSEEDIQGPGFQAAGRYNPVSQRVTLLDDLEARTGKTVGEVFRHEVCHAANPAVQVPDAVVLRTSLYAQRPRNVEEEAARYCEAGQEALDWLFLAHQVCGDEAAFPVGQLVAPVSTLLPWPRVRRMRAPLQVQEIGATRLGPGTLDDFLPLWVDEDRRHIRLSRVLDGPRGDVQTLEVDLATWEVHPPRGEQPFTSVAQVWRAAGMDFRTWTSPFGRHDVTGEEAGVIAVDRHAAFRVGEVDLLLCGAPDGYVAWFPAWHTLVILGDEVLRLHRYAD